MADIWLREWDRVVKRPVYFLAPILVMGFCFLFFLSLMKEGWPNSLPAAVVDLDNSSLSRNLIRNLDASAQTRITSHCADYAEARDLMQRGEVYAFVVIPADFARNLQTGSRPELTFYVNDTYLIPGSLAFKDLSFMCQLTSAGVRKSMLEAKGIVDRNQQMAVLQPVAIDAHLVANPWANYGIYLINMLLPGVLQLIVIMITLFTIGTELKEKTSREWFQKAGGSAGVALSGKLIPYTILFTMLGIAGNIILFRYMHFTFNGNMAWMCLSTFLFVLSSQAMGIFFMELFPVLRDAISLGAFYGLLGFTYAGFTFPIEAMPQPAQIFAWLFPMRYYFLLYGNIALNGSDTGYSIAWFGVLTLFLFLPLPLIQRFRKAAVYQSFTES
jgi:ABC-2 type transport system permease protein